MPPLALCRLSPHHTFPHNTGLLLAIGAAVVQLGLAVSELAHESLEQVGQVTAADTDGEGGGEHAL